MGKEAIYLEIRNLLKQRGSVPMNDPEIIRLFNTINKEEREEREARQREAKQREAETLKFKIFDVKCEVEVRNDVKAEPQRSVSYSKIRAYLKEKKCVPMNDPQLQKLFREAEKN